MVEINNLGVYKCQIVSLATEMLNVFYRDTLDTISKARYLDKLKIIDGKDPYEVNKGEWKYRENYLFILARCRYVA
jgi:hypothetical protein